MKPVLLVLFLFNLNSIYAWTTFGVGPTGEFVGVDLDKIKPENNDNGNTKDPESNGSDKDNKNDKGTEISGIRHTSLDFSGISDEIIGGLSVRNYDDSPEVIGGLSVRNYDDSPEVIGGLSVRNYDDSTEVIGGLSVRNYDDTKWATNQSEKTLALRDEIAEKFEALDFKDQKLTIQNALKITLSGALAAAVISATFRTAAIAMITALGAEVVVAVSFFAYSTAANADENVDFYFTPEGVSYFNEVDASAEYILSKHPELNNYFKNLHSILIKN